MAHWVLSCLGCQQQFPHSEIRHEDSNFLSSPFGIFFDKPPFPEDGLELKCPHCGQKSVYQRHQLTLRMS